MAKIFKIIVELYELLITARKDDRTGRVVSAGSLKIDDIVNIAVAQRTDLNAVTLRAAYEILKEIAIDEVRGGKTVEFGLSHYGLSVSGVFIGDHAAWSDGDHRLHINAIPTAEAVNALKEVTVEVRGMAQSGLCVNTVTDTASGEVNTRLTPGGGVNVTGVKIKITGNSPSIGIYLTDAASGAAVKVAATSILVNEPSKVTFIAPANLPAGDYRLSIATQYSGSTVLKEPRIYVFEYALSCE